MDRHCKMYYVPNKVDIQILDTNNNEITRQNLRPYYNTGKNSSSSKVLLQKFRCTLRNLNI